jgi:hypothetical protein
VPGEHVEIRQLAACEPRENGPRRVQQPAIEYDGGEP